MGFIETCLKKAKIVELMPSNERRKKVRANCTCEYMTKGEAFDFLKIVVLVWNNEDEEFLFPENLTFPNVSDSAYEYFLMQNMDMSGSPGHEEQEVLNMIDVSWPYIPVTLADQFKKFIKQGYDIRGFSPERKIGIVIKNGKARLTAGGKMYINKKDSIAIDDITITL